MAADSDGDNEATEYGYAAVNCYRQKKRKAVSAFAALIASPASGAFTMPAGAKLSFVATAGATAGDTLATITGATNRTIKARTLGIGGRQMFDFAERGVVITPSAGIEVDVDTGLAVWKKIAEG